MSMFGTEGGGFDMNALLAQAQAMQQQMANAQAELAATTVEGTAGGDLVQVTMTGEGDVTAVVIAPADGQKCERCWQVLAEVGKRADHPEICGRCADAVAHHRAAAE